MISIGKMAQYCHTSIQTLRYYDQIGLLKPQYRDVETNYRYYDPEQIFSVLTIQYLQSTGLALKEIGDIMQTPTIDLLSFWQNQETRVKQRLAQEQKMLDMTRFQQHQAKEIELLQKKLGQGVYQRKLDKIIMEEELTESVNPLSIPDQAIAPFNLKLAAQNVLPNLEYGFTLRARHFENLNEIRYLTTFKEVSLSKGHDVSGNYLGIVFRWNPRQYLNTLNQLLKVAEQQYHLSSPLVFEDTYPLNYNPEQARDGQNALTELRIKL